MVVSDIAERDALSVAKLNEQGKIVEAGVVIPGTLVYVQSEDKIYKCTKVADGKATWAEFTTGGGGGENKFVLKHAESGSTTANLTLTYDNVTTQIRSGTRQATSTTSTDLIYHEMASLKSSQYQDLTTLCMYPDQMRLSAAEVDLNSNASIIAEKAAITAIVNRLDSLDAYWDNERMYILPMIDVYYREESRWRGGDDRLDKCVLWVSCSTDSDDSSERTWRGLDFYASSTVVADGGTTSLDGTVHLGRLKMSTLSPRPQLSAEESKTFGNIASVDYDCMTVYLDENNPLEFWD